MPFIFSADSHIREPNDLFVNALPPSLKPRAILAERKDGYIVTRSGEQIIHRLKIHETVDFGGTKRIGLSNLDDRMKDMALDGIDAELIFPSLALWTFTLLFTFVEALFPVSWATVGDYFGRKHFATIRGSMSFFYLWGPALGPVITGLVYDRHQSYAPLMNAYIAVALLAGLLYASLRQPEPRD